MLKSYWVIALRNLRKNATYSIINISGLAIGSCCSLLILLWVFDELSFDKFIPKSNRLYQVWVRANNSGTIAAWNAMPLPVYETTKAADSHIKRVAIADWGGDHLLTAAGSRIVKRGHYVSEEFLEMFEFPLVSGTAAQVLDDPLSVVVTQSTAKALFGDEDPINKVIRIDNENDLRVTGVLKDVPRNSSFQFDFLLTWKYREQTKDWVRNSSANWGNYAFQVFVELNSPADQPAVENSLKDMLTRHGETDAKKDLFIYPMLRWRLHSNFEHGEETGGLYDYVQLFTIIAIFILVIACINFMNLATARSEKRSREVGIRKAVGSRRFELILQFVGESLFISFLSLTIAVLLAELILPFYNRLVEKQLFIDYADPFFWLFGVGLAVFTGIVSGSYPAFYLSSFKPISALKGKIQAGKAASTPRRVLVTLQFSFSILLTIGTIVIYQQIQLVKGRALGYDRENLIAINYTSDIHKNYRAIKLELLASGVVADVTKSNSAITDIESNNVISWPGKPEQLRVNFTTIATEYDYARTMGIKVLEGRDFSEDYKSDTMAILVNKAGIALMDLKEPIGTQLEVWGTKRNLIGIVDDVLMGSPDEPIRPMFMIFDPGWCSAVSVRLKETGDLQASLEKVKAIFEKYASAYPFDYKFADIEFQKKFTAINLTSKLSTVFASLTIFITGLGLLGLAAFTAEQRTKEVGIRKVMGASVPGLVSLISKDFARLVVASFLISSPMAWWLLNKYLERYAIRTEVGWWVFPITGLAIMLFALTIVSTQALRAANANPARSLRND